MKNLFTRVASLGATVSLTLGMLAACGKPAAPPVASAGPAFAINSPLDGSLTAGTFVFSVQPLDPGTVADVSFAAGDTVLGTDDNPADGLRIYVRAADLPEGRAQLSATVTGHDGRSRTQTVTINNVPAPESSASVGNQGAVLGTTEADGSQSTLIVPPGGLQGANLEFEARTQAEVLSETGVDYDALGLTFLGAQQLETDRELDRMLMLTSGGFGPDVQPNQVVVNYLIMPDSNADGIDEIIVANTASVTPDGDVISDPVPVLQVGATATTSHLGTSSVRSLADGLSGAPGTLLRIPVSGFNPSSAWNNIAVFEGGGGPIEQNGVIHISASGAQTFVTAIPPLRPGNATVTLRNIGSGLESDSFRISVQELPAPGGDPLEIINGARDELLALLQEFDSQIPGTDSSDLRSAIAASLNHWTATIALENTPEADAALADMAAMLQVSDLSGIVAGVRADLLGGLRVSQAGCNDILDKADTAINVVNWVARIPYLTLSPTNAVDIIGPELQGGMVGKGWNWAKNTALEIDRALGGNACREDAPQLPGPTGPSENGIGGPGAVTGMGAAFPAGGGLVGSVNGSGFNPFSPASSAQGRGRYAIKLSSSTNIPFSGSTDASGYFVIPLTPAGETITVTVVDTETGEVEVIVVEGPETGTSEFLDFSFTSTVANETVTWTGAAGDGSWATPGNWSSNQVPQPYNDVVIASPSATVTLDSRLDASIIQSLSLSEGTLELGGTGELTILFDSSVGSGGTFAFTGFDAELALAGDLLVQGQMLWSRGEILGSGALLNRGTLVISGDGGTRQLSGSLVNEGSLVLDGTYGLRIGNGGTIRNEAGATIDIRSDAGFDHGGNPAGVIHNSGTVQKTGGTGVSEFRAQYHSDSGTLRSDAGTILLRVGGSSGAGSRYEVATGATIDIGYGTAVFSMNGTQSGAGAGELRLTGGDLVIAAAGATFDFPNGKVVWAGSDIQGDGLLRNSGLLEVSNVLGFHSVLHSITLRNEGRLVLNSGSSDHLRVGTGATIHNLPTAEIEIVGNASIGFAGGPQGIIINEGTVRKTSGDAESRLNVHFDNQEGTVQVESGRLIQENGSGVGGNFEVAAGAVLKLGWTSSREFELAGVYAGSGSGTILLTGDIIADPSGLTLDFPNGRVQLDGTLTGEGGVITNFGLLEVMHDSGASIDSVTFNNSGTFNVLGDGSGYFRVGQGLQFNNLAAGIFDIQGDLNIGSAGGITAVFNNNGILQKSAGSGAVQVAMCYLELAGGSLLETSGSITFNATCP